MKIPLYVVDQVVGGDLYIDLYKKGISASARWQIVGEHLRSR